LKRWSGVLALAWKVEFHPHALKELSRLDRVGQQRILRLLRERIETGEDPRRLGSPLHGPKRDLWKYRIGDYRLLCDIRNDEVLVLVLRVGHRKEIYR
jgi:mRNA interferase RelE/StbE